MRKALNTIVIALAAIVLMASCDPKINTSPEDKESARKLLQDVQPMQSEVVNAVSTQTPVQQPEPGQTIAVTMHEKETENLEYEEYIVTLTGHRVGKYLITGTISSIEREEEGASGEIEEEIDIIDITIVDTTIENDSGTKLYFREVEYEGSGKTDKNFIEIRINDESIKVNYDDDHDDFFWD